MEERDPWAAFGSKKFPFPNRKRSKKILLNGNSDVG